MTCISTKISSQLLSTDLLIVHVKCGGRVASRNKLGKQCFNLGIFRILLQQIID